METWTVNVKQDPGQLAERLIWPNGIYKADRRIVDGLKNLAANGICHYLDDDEDPCHSKITISESQAHIEYDKPQSRSLDYGARHLAEIVSKLMSEEISPEAMISVRVNSCVKCK